jgi:histone-lysine N-methyltransferase ASH1L
VDNNDASISKRKANAGSDTVADDAEKRVDAKKSVIPSSGSTPTVQRLQPQKSSRRSSRLSLLDQAKDIMKQTANNALGKRSRGQKTEKPPADRRASLRPRDVNIPVVSKAASKVEEPPKKKMRRSEAGISAPKTTATTAKAVEEEKPKPVPHKRKRWLSHGLYAGQHAFDPNPAPLRGDRRQSAAAESRAYLPLPRYSGANILENGRDFKLPFDIFSPLPPGQPKPDEWRKTNKSMNSHQTQSSMLYLT